MTDTEFEAQIKIALLAMSKTRRAKWVRITKAMCAKKGSTSLTASEIRDAFRRTMMSAPGMGRF